MRQWRHQSIRNTNTLITGQWTPVAVSIIWQGVNSKKLRVFPTTVIIYA